VLPGLPGCDRLWRKLEEPKTVVFPDLVLPGGS
jgi:hypothetical protein